MTQFTLKTVLAAALIWMVSCHAAEKQFAAENIPAAATDEIPVQVHTKTIEKMYFSYSIASNGKLASADQHVFYAQAGGIIHFGNAIVGKYYRKGDLVASTDTTSLVLRMEKAQLAKFSTEREYESQLLGYENLLKGKSAGDIDRIKRKLGITAGVYNADIEIKECRYEMEKAIIKSPVNGLIADIKIQDGIIVKTGDELFKIYDPSKFILEIKVLESDIKFIQLKQEASISPVSVPDKDIRAQVAAINPYVDENGMITVKLTVNSYSVRNNYTYPALLPGMSCTATIKTATTHSVVVPRQAVVYRGEKPVVFTLNNEKSLWNYVVLGRETENEIEVLKGLKEGDKIIVSNNLQLVNNSTVKDLGEQ